MFEATTGIWALFVSAFISSTIAPGGSEAVLAYLILEDRQQVKLLVTVATIGNTLGAMTTWGLGLIAAKKFPLPSQLPEQQQKALSFMRERGLWVLLFSWLPVIGDVFCFAGGWLKCAWLPAVLFILIGKLGRYTLIAWMLV